MEDNWLKCQSMLAGIGLLILIFDSNLALEGARAGMELCLRSVIPSLFPFFVLSMILTTALSKDDSCFSKAAVKYWRIPNISAPVLIPAFLGGYPVGAKCVGDMYHRNQISRLEAERLLTFCSNAGPSFLFGMVSVFFPERKMVWLLWMIHIVSAGLTAAMHPTIQKNESKRNQREEAKEQSVIMSAAKAMCMVCCWVILFRTILSFLNVWFLWIFPPWVQVLIMGSLELANGCCALPLITDVNWRFVLCACMLSFGGICVLLQTASVTKGLSLIPYVKGKLMQTGFSFLLSLAFVRKQGLITTILLLIMVMFLRKMQNRYRNPEVYPV